jgi:hypothetical protein
MLNLVSALKSDATLARTSQPLADIDVPSFFRPIVSRSIRMTSLRISRTRQTCRIGVQTCIGVAARFAQA